MSWEEMLKGLVKSAGVSGLKALEEAVDDLSKEAKNPWKKAILQLAGEAVDTYGADGIKRIEKMVDRLIKDKNDKLEFASLKARSDYLAAIENMEADDKNRVREFVMVVGQKLGIILKAIIAGLVG